MLALKYMVAKFLHSTLLVNTPLGTTNHSQDYPGVDYQHNNK
jgi:hypothetical protein